MKIKGRTLQDGVVFGYWAKEGDEGGQGRTGLEGIQVKIEDATLRADPAASAMRRRTRSEAPNLSRRMERAAAGCKEPTRRKA